MKAIASAAVGLVLGVAIGAGVLFYALAGRSSPGRPAEAKPAQIALSADAAPASEGQKPAYLLVLGEVLDREKFASGYMAHLPPIYAKFGGSYLAAGRNFETFEGEGDFKSFVISKWPSMGAVRAFWSSSEYDALRRARIDGNWGRFDVFALEGLPEAPISAEADRAALRAFGDRWRAAYAAGDLESLARLLEEDVWLMSRDQPAKKGKAAALAWFASQAGSRAKVDISFDYEEMTIEGDRAYVIAIWRLAVTPQGREPIRDAGRTLLILKRGADGAWRIWRDMDNRTPDVALE